MTLDETARIVEELVKVTDQMSAIMDSMADVMYLQSLNIRFLISRVEELENS